MIIKLSLLLLLYSARVYIEESRVAACLTEDLFLAVVFWLFVNYLCQLSSFRWMVTEAAAQA